MRFIVFFVLLMSCVTAQAQLIVKEFYTKDDKLTDEKSSYYYKIGEKAILLGPGTKRDTSFVDTVKTFYTSNHKIRSKEFYRDGWKEGLFANFHENGKYKDRGSYKQGKRIGYLSSWYENGAMQKNIKFFPTDIYSNNTGDSILIINYWNEENVQIVKNGSGYCTCYLDSDKVLEKGKVLNGYRDSTWQFFRADTLRHVEEFTAGKFLSGKGYYKNREYSYDRLETQAEFPGGIQAMMRFLQRNIIIPNSIRGSVTGKSFVKFIVDKEGFITEVSILKSAGKNLDDEAMRVVKKMPRWKPGTQRGIPVKSQFVLPVYFKRY